MEKRLILAFGLSAAFLFAWMWVYESYIAPPPARVAETQQPPTSQPEQAPAAPVKTEPAPERPVEKPARVAPVAAPETRPRPPQRTAAVEGPLYRGAVSTEGGKLQEWTLKYRGEKPMVIVGDLGPAGLLVSGRENAAPEAVPMTTQAERVQLGPERPTEDLVLTGDEAGLRVRQVLGFHADSYVIDLRMRIENPGTAPRPVTVAVPWTARYAWGDAHEKFPGQLPREVVWADGQQIVRVEDVTSLRDVEIDGQWIALDSVWYVSALVPRSGGFKLAMSAEKPPESREAVKGPAGRVTIALRATPTIAPGQAWEGHVALYLGPKEYERLAALGLEGTINFGGFPLPRKYGGLPMEWLGVPILRLLKWVYDYVGNYGVAIIILTILSKVLFYPLTVKSMRSMKAMQALAPQVNALRSKYKSDPQRLQRETMELYRKHRVNPLGGCLPMVAQIPIFYALYLALSVSVELQNASFLCIGRAPSWVPFLGGHELWICDLANYDPIYILPVLMGVTMFIQQKMTPVMGDPRQAKMMLFMPFIFTVMFFNLPSGLVLYWTVSNVLQIMQQKLMDRPGRAATAREAKDASRA
jgi:YidC/Oxa1 family membrane protein insertase